MALYYISAQRGSDNNNGTSPVTPWVTINKAVGEVAPGDTVYIGPGTYREKITLITSGVAGNPITWYPDPNAKYVIGDKPGIVRVTGCGEDEMPTDGIVWNYNGKDYNTLGASDGRIYIDGSSDNYTISAGSGTERIAINVVAHGYSGFYYGTNINCISLSGYCGFYSSINTNCLSLSGYYGFYSSINTNCLSLGGLLGFHYGTNANCLSLGGNWGFHYGTNTNCMAMGVYYAFEGNGSYTFSHCRAIACLNGFYGISTSNKMDISTCSYVWCQNNYRMGGYTTENGSLAKVVIFDLLKFAEAFKPLLQFDRNDGDNTVSVGDIDILGYVRRLGSGIIDIGPFEHSLVTPDFDNYKTQEPAIKIERAGMQRFTFFADGGKEFTRKVWVKWSGYASIDKPQMVIDGAHIERMETTATGDGTDWEQLTVSATPTVGGEIELYLYSRDTNASAVTYFSDLE